MEQEKFPHIFLDKRFRQRDQYTAKKLNIQGPDFPARNRKTHADFLRGKLNDAWSNAKARQAVAHSTRDGVYIEFRSDPDEPLLTKGLEDIRSKKIRLLNIREEVDAEERITTYATVYVSNDKRKHFLDKIDKFRKEDTEKGNPKNKKLVSSIADVREALLVDSFWTDEKTLIPAEDAKWIEVWLRGEDDIVDQKFRDLCASNEIPIEEGSIVFPERRVVIIQANKEQLKVLTLNSDHIAEFRAAKETSAFWLGMQNVEQAKWVKDLQDRIVHDPATSVVVCILDTGINRGHPLLAPLLSESGCQTVDPTWGKEDHKGHGTLMAGVVAFGDLRHALDSNDSVQVVHKLESIKILPPGENQNLEKLWGYLTSQSVSLAELASPDSKRVVCLAVTSTDTRDRGSPSSWSGSLDKITSGQDNGIQQLFIVSAGNLEEVGECVNYPDNQILESVHDPAQSWNSISVGAYTSLARLTNPDLKDYTPIAPAGGLCPFTSTSDTWEDQWPLKPDIVLEGGNLAVNSSDFYDESDDLCVLSTNHEYNSFLLAGFNMTSAATAQASWMASQIMAEYPNYWPETIRGLIIHSATWTDKLKEQFLNNSRHPNKGDFKRLVRICGWGVPNLGNALHTARNSLTLISEAETQPFAKKEGRVISNDMHVYDLPWPKDVLLSLAPETEVSMRVTLSYFIEPGPGEIGWKDRYRYPSHQLRFSINRPDETKDEFRARISTAVELDQEVDTSGEGDRWQLGSQNRHKGSIHSDYWVGSAADLATSNLIAVYPKTGWWKERSYLGKAESKCRYSLIVSISSPEETIDLYTPIAQKVAVQVEISS